MYRKVTVVFLFLLVIAVLTSCSGNSDQLAANKSVVKKAFAVLDSHEYGNLDQYIAENYMRHCQATPEAPEVHSLDEFRKLLKSWDVSMPDAK